MDLLICDELGFVPFDRTGGEILFHILADRYERRSTMVSDVVVIPISDMGRHRLRQLGDAPGVKEPLRPHPPAGSCYSVGLRGHITGGG